MFVMTLRKVKLKKIGIACACGAVVLAAAIGLNSILSENNEQQTMETAAMTNLQMSSAQDLVSFLQGYSVETDVSTATVSTVTVPKKWDDSFIAFNEVIEQSGLSLEKYKGKEVDKWSLLVPAQSNEKVKMYAIVLVHDSSAVAAYLLEKPSGEVLPLKQAEQTALPLTDEETAGAQDFGSDTELIIVTDGQDIQGDTNIAQETPVATDIAVQENQQASVESATPSETGSAQSEIATGAAPTIDESVFPTD